MSRNRVARRPDGSRPRVICDEVTQSNPNVTGPCHVYRGAKVSKGYGSIVVGYRKTNGVHRYVWELENGPIPKGIVIDHMCRNRGCCNIDHLRAVTPKINSLENSVSFSAVNSAKTHCVNGHEFTPENTCPQTNGGRWCRECGRIRNRAFMKKKRDKAKELKSMVAI